MATLAEIRQQYPQYQDMSDADLASALHAKFYADLPQEEFAKKIGLTTAAPQERINNAFADVGVSQEAAPPKQFGLGDTWPVRMAKDIYSAVTLPGDVAQGKFQVQPEKPGEWSEIDQARQDMAQAEMGKRTMDLAQTVSPVSPAARAGVGFMGAIKTKEAAAPTQEALSAASDAGYSAARNMPFEMKSQAVRDWAAKMQAQLEGEGRLKEFAPDTHTVLDKLQSGEGDALATGGNLISVREALREASRNFTNPREKAAAEKAIREFDKFVSAPPQEAVMAGSAPEFASTAEGARRNYASLSRSEQLSEALRAADLQAGSSHSGGNLDNATRQRFKSILLSDKNSAGYSPDEIAQMERVVKGSGVADTTRAIGKFLGGGGGLGALHAAATGGAAGYAAGGPIGAAVGLTAPGVGYGMKKIADALTRREVQRLDEMVRRRSALGDEMPLTEINQMTPRQKLLARSLMLQAQPQAEAAIEP